MKKLSVLMVMIAAILFATSCKKDEKSTPEDNSPVVKNGFRISEIKVIGAYSSTTEIEYEGDKVKKTVFSEENIHGDKSTSKKEYSYDGDKITMIKYRKDNDDWVKKDDNSYNEFIVKEGLLVERAYKSSYIDKDGKEHKYEDKTIYTYDDKKLTKKEMREKYMPENREDIAKTEYKYLDGKVEVLANSVDGKSKKVVIYKGDKIEKIEYYFYSEEEQNFKKHKYETLYTYSGDNISRIEEWYSNKLETSRDYTYDANGNLIEIKRVSYVGMSSSEETTITTLKYEKGDGNGYIFVDPENYLIFKTPHYY